MAVLCTYCGTELPADAMFCGECGRAVVVATTARPIVPSPLTRPVPDAEPGMVCEQCGAAMASDDIFCGECGFVTRSAGRFASRPRDTNVVERLEKVELSEPEPAAELAPEPEPAAQPVPEPEREPDPAVQSEPEREPAPQAAPHAASEVAREAEAPAAAEPLQASPSAPAPAPATAPPIATATAPAPELAPAPEPVPAPEPAAPDDDVEATRIVARPAEGERFVLQFSTGESFTVYGSGLIGRSPRAEPGEYVDQLVRILDPSRSVSKTHLEFGQEAGSFWVKDRYSGNGTIVREPDSPPQRCHPERRYRLVRGSRVDVGEQFFIVS